MDEDGIGAVGVTAVAALALLVGLFLPLFTVRCAKRQHLEGAGRRFRADARRRVRAEMRK